MYRITRTLFVCKHGDKEHSAEVVDVADLEEYRASIMQSRYKRINFVYQVIPDEK